MFPGGVGTCEEILYLLGILLREENAHLPFPLVFTGPTSAAPYFEQIDQFLRLTLGEAATARYRIVTGDLRRSRASRWQRASATCASTASRNKDSFYFNWSLDIPLPFQQPFVPTHEAMAALDLHHGRKPSELAADLRRAFSGIVAGNVKEEGMRRVEQLGPYKIHGDPDMMQALDALLRGVRRAAPDEDRRGLQAVLRDRGLNQLQQRFVVGVFDTLFALTMIFIGLQAVSFTCVLFGVAVSVNPVPDVPLMAIE